MQGVEKSKSCYLQKRLAENIPRTLDNTREFDPSFLTADPNAPGPSSSGDSQQDELAEEIASDPFAAYFSSADDPTIAPKILITTSPKASKPTYEFCDELVGIFPGAEFIRRKKGKGFELGRIAGWAADRGYKHLCVVNEDMKKPSMLRTTFHNASHILRCYRRYHTGVSSQWSISILQADICPTNATNICAYWSLPLWSVVCDPTPAVGPRASYTTLSRTHSKQFCYKTGTCNWTHVSNNFSPDARIPRTASCNAAQPTGFLVLPQTSVGPTALLYVH